MMPQPQPGVAPHPPQPAPGAPQHWGGVPPPMGPQHQYAPPPPQQAPPPPQMWGQAPPPPPQAAYGQAPPPLQPAYGQAPPPPQAGYYGAPPPAAPAPAGPNEVRTLWIGDLQYWMDENYVYGCFASTGEVRASSIPAFLAVGICGVPSVPLQEELGPLMLFSRLYWQMSIRYAYRCRSIVRVRFSMDRL